MLGDKEQVDKHVRHLLAKCCSLNERKLKALEIAKLYYGVNQFVTAKSYVEGYLEVRPDSVPALLLQAKINEDLDNLSAALSAYKKVLSLSSSDKTTILHACSLALESKDASEVEFWSEVSEDMFPSEKITFMLKEKVLSSKNENSALLKLLKSQLQKDESDSEVCIKLFKLLHSSGSPSNAFTHCLRCINAGHHFGIASWFHECLSFLESFNLVSINENIPEQSLSSVHAVCLMELIRVTSQTSCLSDIRDLLAKLEVISHELSKSQSGILNALYKFTVVWLDFYGGVYVQRRLLDSSAEPLDNFQYSLVYHFYKRVITNQQPQIFHGSSSLSALVWSHLYRESFSLRIQAGHLVQLFTSFRNNMRSEQYQTVNFQSLPWKQLMDWVDGSPVPDSIKSHAFDFNADKSYTFDIFDAKNCILDYLSSADCLNLIMWICAQQLSPENSNPEDFTLNIPRLDFIYKLVTKLFPNLNSYCSSPVFGSTIEGQSIPNTSIDQLCQIDIINFMITCFLHMSIRSLSKPESKYSKSLCSHLIIKPETSGIGLDILFLPLCLIPAAQLSTSTQRAWWSAFIKQVIESGSRSTINDSDRALLRCGLNQLRLVFHPTSCLNGGKGIMNPPLLFRVAQALTHIVLQCSPKKMENIELWPLHYWEAALKNHILGPSNEPRTSVLQSLSGSFCSGYTNSGVNNCLSPLRNRNITQPSKSELTGSHILFVLPSSYNGWRGVFNESASVVSLSRHWCNTGWLWCFDKLESRSKTADKLDTIDEGLLRSLIRLCEYDSSICNEATRSCGNRLLNSLILKSKPHGINNLKADFGKASSRFDGNQDFSGLESQSSKLGSFVKTSIPTDLSNSITQESQTVLSPSVKTNTDDAVSRLNVVNDKRSSNIFEPSNTENPPMTSSPCPSQPPSSINTPICSPSKAPPSSTHHIVPTLTCSLVKFYDTLQSTAGVQISHTGAGDQSATSAYRQDTCLSNLISVWQTLVSGLSCQLAETKLELTRSRELNEQLSKQLSETSKQLSDAVNKFIEFQNNNQIATAKSAANIIPVSSASNALLETPAQELSKAITELRHWLPEGMAAAACAAVNARLSPPGRTQSLGQHQSPCRSETPIQSNNRVTVHEQQQHHHHHHHQQQQKISTVISSPKPHYEDVEEFPEAYEPTVNFKPVLETLPDLVDSKTGEENDERLFCERARLYRWEKESESWKTRGVGEIRILKNTITGKCRLVMRRDQVKKLCANHYITSSIKLSPSTKDPRMTIWAAKDYSESTEGIDELFMIQFKSPEILGEFSRIFSECTAKTSGNNAPADTASEAKDKSSKNKVTPAKSQPSSATAIQSTPNVAKPQIAECKNNAQVPKQVDSMLSKFAPKSGSWECPTCLLYHDASVTVCSACKTPKPGSSSVSTATATTTTSASATATSKATLSTPLFGGFLKSTGGFVFGQTKTLESSVSATTTTTTTTATPTTTTGSATPPKPVFSFVATSPKLNTNLFPTTSSQTPGSMSFIFGNSLGTTTTTTTTTSSSSSSSFVNVFPSTLSTSDKKPIFPPIASTTSVGSGQSGFTFSFAQGDSHVDNNNDDDDDKVELVDDSKLTFKPVLEVMPKKIEVFTGEENDEVIFCHRAKLYRWDNNAWHERGVGDLKLLRSTVTGVIRCLMRREHVLKVCCNHVVGVGMQLKPMNTGGGRAWSWWAIDYAEQSEEGGQTTETESTDLNGGRRETFAARFKLTEHSEEFRRLFEEAVQAAEDRLNTSQSGETTKPSKKYTVDLDQQSEDTDSDVVVVERPLKVSNDQIIEARKLKLPDGFYSYKNGEVTGESEGLTAEEEAEEDSLLEAAIQRHTTLNSKQSATTTTASVGFSVTTLTPSSKQNDTPTQNKPVTTVSPATYVPQVKGLLDFSALNSAVSKDSQPLWGSSTKSSGWSNAGAQLFATSTTTTTNKGEEDEEDPSAGDHDPHYEPIVALPKLTETKTGEEEELCIFLRRCRAYRYVDKEWKERGVGEIKVLVRPRTMPTDVHFGPRDVVPSDYTLTDIGRARILMRRDQILKLCLNHPISSDLPVFKPMGSSASANSLCWVGEDYSEGTGSLETLAVRFKFDTDANEFKAAVARAQSALKSS
ncbi:unnamed protein product [Trichobilharzia szidati]|nr:unnamed protein product [Trichobilharzia szidati]